jgi:P-type E1-E2 ATPase
MSDKTGTLTCNKMIFKEVVIGQSKYSSSFEKNNSLMKKANSVQSLIN